MDESARLATENLVNEQEWHLDENWRGWFGAYASPRDTRTLVPRRNPALGWTLNFAHATAWWYLLGLSIVPLGFLLLFVLVQLSR